MDQSDDCEARRLNGRGDDKSGGQCSQFSVRGHGLLRLMSGAKPAFSLLRPTIRADGEPPRSALGLRSPMRACRCRSVDFGQLFTSLCSGRARSVTTPGRWLQATQALPECDLGRIEARSNLGDVVGTAVVG